MRSLLQRFSLRTTATVLTFVVASLFAALSLVMVQGSLERSYVNSTGLLAAARARMAGDVMGTELADLAADMHSVRSAIYQFRLQGRAGDIQEWLENIQRAKSEYTWIGITDAKGRVIVGTHGLKAGTDESTSPWFLGGSKGLHYGFVREALRLKYELPPLEGGEKWQFIDIAMPLMTGDNQLGGVLATHLSWPWLRSRLYALDSAFPAGSELWLLGPDGRTWTQGDAQPPGPLDIEPLRLARQGKSGWMTETWPDGQRYITGYSPAFGRSGPQGLSWVAMVRQRADQLPLAFQHQFDALVVAAEAAVLLVTSAVWLACTVWLRQLAGFARRIGALRDSDRPPTPPANLPQEFEWANEAMIGLVNRLQEKEATLQRALADVESSFRAVGTSFPGVLGTFRISIAGKLEVTYASEACGHYLGVSADHLRQQPGHWSKCANAEDVHKIGKAFSRMVFGAAHSVTQAMRFRGSDGVERTLQATVIQRDAQEGRVFDCICLDISELNEARLAAERASRAKSQFLALMSHELRTPLNVILGLAQALEAALDDPQQRRHARLLREGGETLAAMLTDVLDIVKIEADTFALEPRQFTLDEVVDSSIATFRAIAAAKSVPFAVNTPSDAPALLGDPVRLRQIVHNLLSNAFKFTASGRVSLTVGIAKQTALDEQRRQTHVWISVSDSGTGMSPEQASKMSEPLMEADEFLSERPVGAGLGLAIVKHLLSRMGGTIYVNSQPDVGTTVSLLIPFEIAPEPAPGASPGATPVGDPPLTILVADDYDINRQVLRAILEHRGHTVFDARDGLEAVKLVSEQHPDLVLMDLDMPNVDGFEATRRIRALTGTQGNVPVYALTGQAFAEDVERAVTAGMDGHLPKPVKLDELVAIVRSTAAQRGDRPAVVEPAGRSGSA